MLNEYQQRALTVTLMSIELKVWQKVNRLCAEVYKLTESFPVDGYVIPEIRKTAASVLSKIAEGYGRNKASEGIEDLYRAYSYLLDLEAQILLAEEFGYIHDEDSKRLREDLGDVVRMLRCLIRSMSL